MDMTPESAETLIRRYVDEVWNEGQLKTVDDLLTSDHLRHDPLLDHDIVGTDAVIVQITELRNALPDLHFAFSTYPAADGIYVTRRWTMTGTHKGHWMGVAPTGSKITNMGMALSRIESGKIAEEWIQRDNVGLRRQIGMT